jgi:hypothetical protein
MQKHIAIIYHSLFKTKRLIASLLTALIFHFSSILKVHAQITNPSLNQDMGQNPIAAKTGITFVTYFIYLWNAIMVVGGLVVLLYFIQAAIEWITAGGDSGKITKARDRMIQSTIGLFILVFSFIIVNFISNLLFANVGFNPLNLSLPDIN